MERALAQKVFIHKAIKRINIAAGAVRSGKSVGADFLFINEVSRVHEDADIFLIGKTIHSLKRNVINPLKRYLGKDFIYRPGKLEAYLWGRTIHTIGASDEKAVGKIQGASIGLVLCDELTLYP